MLRALSIRDFVIVDQIELEFDLGFTVFTGETGAGKSILIDALSFALGSRSDAGVVREGAAKADIAAEFSSNAALDAWLTANEFTSGEECVLLRRVIDRSGRSKAFVNGAAATTAQLREAGERLVDIYGQHAHQSLLKIEAQRILLDDHAGLQAQADCAASAYKEWRATVKRREQLEAGAHSEQERRERLEWQVSELRRLAPRPGEWEEIGNEHARLAHAATLIEAAQQALTALSEADNPIVPQISAINQKIGKLAAVDRALQPVLELLEPALIQLREAAHVLNTYLNRIELEPQRLAEVEARLAALHSAARKFRIAPEQLPQELETLNEQLRRCSDSGDLTALRLRERHLESQYRDAAGRLSKARIEAARVLAETVTSDMQELAMEGGCFAVELLPCEASWWGLEQVEFRVAGHAGAAPRPLARVASGGELSRIALALSVATTKASAIPTLIFDEVDSGVGGAVAEVVGRMLKRLGREHQVLCVTHLAQVASQADHHYEVTKTSVSGKAATSIAALESEARIEEIARMLGGIEITATTRRHARELLAY